VAEKLEGISPGTIDRALGELRINKKGQAKSEGMVHKISPEEGDIVRKMYKEFIEGRSISKSKGA